MESLADIKSKDPAPIAPGPREVPRWKRVLDTALILLAMPLLLPLMLFIAVLVRCVSAGPVLFRQERVGHLGSRFRCFKFRTMQVGNNAAVHQGHLKELMDSNAPMVKMDVKGDARIIPFGVPLRASGLDELPQIFNVLFGQMSLVGPRPCVPYEYDSYLPWQKERFDVLPGLTGFWQVSGKNNTTFEEMMRLDIYYARNSSVGFDLRIIFKTVPALLIQMFETRRRRKAEQRATLNGGGGGAATSPALLRSGTNLPTTQFKMTARTKNQEAL
ncbi:MAG TPA: sugar transferase [Verrucomicrobiae bacterium]|nr:sugar transferase [Verrucomicrobiae bacterium]